ncbi:MAG: hypothetical protein KAS02_02260 [Candidatus Pacebacteria bacterium]|nr:hypothetical protein [Candidatus Paceibacterota bacterium]
MEYVVYRDKAKQKRLWLTRIQGLWFWGDKKRRAFHFDDEAEALKIGLREALGNKKKKKVRVVPI